MSDLKIKDLEKLLLEEISSRAAALGFDPKPVGQSFRRKTDSGRVSLHVAFIPHKVDVDVTADVAVRIDALEDLVNEDNALLPKSEKANTSSLGVELGNLAEGRPRRWTLAAAGDVPGAADSIIALFERVGRPYLEKYSDPANALQALAGNAPENWAHSPIHGARCRRAVGLAFLLGRHGEVEQLIQSGESFLRSRNDFALKSFQEFAAKIRQRLLAAEKAR